MLKRILNWTARPWVFLLILLGTALVTYGHNLRGMGFYWDDWQAIFIHRLGDPRLFWSYFSYDRPVSAWTYLLTFPLLGSHPAAWQIFTILMRWLTGVGLWWGLRGVWPQHGGAVSWMALLLLIYPGFTQQSVSVAYSQHFITYALFTFSLGLMIWSVRRPPRFWPFTLLSVLLSLLQLLTMEYFAGLELLRPFILWFILDPAGEDWRVRLRKVLRLWLPYAGALAAFLIFRFFYYPRISPDPNANTPVLLLNWLADPLNQTVHFLQIVLQDFLHLNLFAWLNTVTPQVVDLNAKFTLFGWAIGLLIGVLAALFVRNARLDEPAQVEGGSKFHAQAIGLGLLGILLGGLPVWITDRQVIVGLWSDRFSLAPMLGVVILLVGLLAWLVQGRRRLNVILILLVAISVGAQMRTVNAYRKNWTAQREFYWQLAWRIPGLEPGTALLGTKMPFSYVADYSVAFATNIIYAPDLKTTRAPYWFLSALRYRYGEIADFVDGKTIQYDLRTVLFEGKTENALVIGRDSANMCIRVYTPQDAFPPEITNDEVDLLAISHPERIIPVPGQPVQLPREIFGVEPDRDWCYYYEKADLALQEKNWTEITRLWDEARASGLKTKYGFEMLPFVDGFAYQGQWRQAYQVTLEASQATASQEPLICSRWEAILRATPPSAEKDAIAAEIMKYFVCE